MMHTARLVPAVMALLIAAPGIAREVPFATEATIDTATPTSDLRHADVDGDGDVDGVAVAGGEVVWYDNTAGDGSAWTTRSIDTFDSTQIPERVFPADVDGDGDVDVFSIWDRTSPITDSRVGWHENTAGDGSAWTRDIIGSASDFDRIFAADMDRDGDLDVVTGSDFASGSVQWWDNEHGDGTAWTRQEMGACGGDTGGLTVADIDGDADPDVFTLCMHSSGNHSVWWHENTAGTGLAWASEVFDVGAGTPHSGNQSLLAVDVDADGDLDLATTAPYPTPLRKLYLNVPGDFSSRLLSSFPWSGFLPDPHTYDAGDLDQDGDLDVLTAGSTPEPPTVTQAIGWWENTDPDTIFWEKHPVDSPGRSSSAAFATDVDGDGDLDLMASLSDDVATEWTAWHENLTIHRSAYFPDQEVISSSAADPIGLAVADIDGDTDRDVVAASQGDGAIVWYDNDGADPLSFTARTITGAAGEVRWVTTADIDRDGDLDVVGGHSGIPSLLWYENDGASPPSWTARTVSLFATNEPVAAGDLDGDGDPDVALGGSWFESDGASLPAWTPHYSYGPTAMQSVAIADVEGDGDLDIIGTSTSDGIAWYDNDGASSPSFTARSIDAGVAPPLTALPADVDADGDIDVVAGAFDDDEVTWYENDGASAPAWTAHTISAAADGVVSVFPTDFDGDGDVDVVGGMLNSGIIWYENHGASVPFWSPHTILAPTGNDFRVVASDLDGDGDADVVSTDSSGNTVAWYPNRGGQFRLATSDTSPATLVEGTQDDVLSIDITHNGRSGDSDLEVATIELLFEDSGGTPLTTAEASALLAKIGAWAEFGTSGYWDPATDVLVTELTSFTLTDGRLTIVLGDGDPLVQLPTGQMATGYIVLDATADGASQTPNQFRVTHVTESSTSAEDAPHDIALTLEFTPDVTTQLITVPEPAKLVVLLAGVAFLVTVGRRRAGW